jgi:hypothetical protein
MFAALGRAPLRVDKKVENCFKAEGVAADVFGVRPLSFQLVKARPLVCLAVWAVVYVTVVLPVRSEEERYPTLQVGPDTFTNVVVLNKTRTDVFLKHAHGMANIKVHDLDLDTQARLGYEVEQPKPSKMEQVLQAPPVLTALQTNAQLQAAQEQLLSTSQDFIDRFDDRTAIAVTSSIILVYLLFSYMCRCICVKTSNPPSPLIWLPFFKQIPLFKAAGMSPWWILANFLGPVFAIVYIAWSFKIVRARAKHAVWGVLLLLPVTNFFALLYLAASGDGSEPEKENSHKIILAPIAKKEAA